MFDEEHLDDHHECKAAYDAAIRRAEEALKAALQEAIAYVSLDSELPPMIDSWRAALSGGEPKHG
jgi:hypothetical protein